MVTGNEPFDVPTRTAVLEHPAEATDRTLESLRHDVNSGFAEVRGEFAELRREFNTRFDHLADRMDRHLRWVITTVITMAVAIGGANVGILTLLLRPR